MEQGPGANFVDHNFRQRGSWTRGEPYQMAPTWTHITENYISINNSLLIALFSDYNHQRRNIWRWIATDHLPVAPFFLIPLYNLIDQFQSARNLYWKMGAVLSFMNLVFFLCLNDQLKRKMVRSSSSCYWQRLFPWSKSGDLSIPPIAYFYKVNYEMVIREHCDNR